MTLPKLMALLLVVAAAVLLAVGGLYSSQGYVAAGIAVLLFLLLLCVVVLHRRVTYVLLDVRDLAGRSEALSALIRKDDGAIGRLEAMLRESDSATGQAHGETLRALAALEGGVRTASRQSGDAQALTLRTFQDLSAKHEKLLPLLEASMESSRQNEELLALLDTSNKLSRQILRETLSNQKTWTPFVQASTEKLDLIESQVASRSRKILQGIESGKSVVEKLVGSDRDLRVLAQRALGRMQYETVQEVEALQQLQSLFDAKAPVPLLGGFAMQPMSMLAVVAEVLKRRPRLVVECGSGTSTLWIARALVRNGSGRLVSLEHHPEYFEKTRQSLAEHGLGQCVDLRLAPLLPVDVQGESFEWYDTASVADLADIDMLIVDGPPGFTGPMARFPALPLLRERLANGALVLVDDADREEEQEVMRRWETEVEGVGNRWRLAGRTQAFVFRKPVQG